MALINTSNAGSKRLGISDNGDELETASRSCSIFRQGVLHCGPDAEERVGLLLDDCGPATEVVSRVA
jgi:hypothetical protein